MAITSAICSSFKQELLQGKHSFESSGGHTFKIALFDSDASLKVWPPDDSKLCLPCKSSCLKLEHIADVFAIIYSPTGLLSLLVF